eukprot:3885469-Pyramimonas_sp.AAC.2
MVDLARAALGTRATRSSRARRAGATSAKCPCGVRSLSLARVAVCMRGCSDAAAAFKREQARGCRRECKVEGARNRRARARTSAM